MMNWKRCGRYLSWPTLRYCQIFVGSFLGSLFDPEEGCDIFLGISGFLQTTLGADAEGPIPFIN
jgi:hypothetical protein